MEVGIIAMRYAKALLEYAVERQVEDSIYKEVTLLAANFVLFPSLGRTLDNPIITREEKLSLIVNAAGIQVAPELIRFAKLVLNGRREKYLRSMCLMYIDLFRKRKNINIGKLITACPVSKEEEERMKRLVIRRTHGTVEFETKVDPAIIGGFIFEIGTYRLDASIASQFQRVKQQFIEKNRRIV